MFNSNIIDIIITLSFIYLLLALIVSTVGEIINTLIRSRSLFLQEALKSLFDNIAPATKGADTPVYNIICNNPFINILKGKGGKFPSYIPANNIALAVLDMLNPAKENLTVEKIREAINSSPVLSKEENLKKLLLTLLNNSKNSVDNFIRGIERTFNDCMERATGWFKRRTQVITFIISLIIVAWLNVDTISIIKTIWSDKNMLNNAVNLATSYVNSRDTNFNSIRVNTTGTSANESPLEIINSNVDSIKATVITLNELKLPIGWEKFPPDANGIIFMFLGLLISTIAVYLGAPFWFDILKRFINIRGTGVKPKDDGIADKRSRKKS